MARLALPLVILACGALATAGSTGCGPDHGAIRVRPLPPPDGTPARRAGSTLTADRIASYRIAAALDPATHQITATETLTWTNRGAPTRTLPFHLYLNAFKNETTLFMRSARGQVGDTTRGAPGAGGWGWIDVTSVKVAGEAAPLALVPSGPDETVATLTLPAEVATGATVSVEFAFTAQLPEVVARTGFAGEFHLVAQWFPKIGVRAADGVGWECEPLHAFTEFYADFGTYDVELTVPNTYVVAATGVLTGAVDAPGGTRTLTYRAEDVHDFAWMADPYMEVRTGIATVDGSPVTVRVYHRPEHADFALRHLDAAVATVEKFSAWFVPYPWSTMTVVDPPLDAVAGAGGMEYPTFVTTAGDTALARPGMRLPEYVTVHEVGHSWFQGLLASNEPVEAWLDEGVNEWAGARLMTEVWGPRGSALDWRGWQAELSALRRAVADDPGSLPSPIASAAYAFVDGDAYGAQTYATAARALSTLEQTVGPQRFAAAIKAYATQWAFKHPTGRDLFETLGRELGQDLTWFVGPVFQQVGGLELGIRTATCRLTHAPRGVFGAGPDRRTVGQGEAPDTGAYACELVITSTGTVHVPLDIEVTFADGAHQRLRWDDRGAGAWQRFEIERSSPLVEVWLDPDNKLALASPMRHHYRLEGDGGAALRAGAWFAHVAQTLMQVVGP